MALRSSNRARLTPAYVHSMYFRLAQPGRQGHDKDDVRDFCARVETELVHLLEERAALFAELRRLPGHPPAELAFRFAGYRLPRQFFPLRAVPRRSHRSGSDARKRARNINPSGFTPPIHSGTFAETPAAESTWQESERVVV